MDAMKNKRIFGIILAVTLLLMIPFVTMQFSDEVKWTLLDFVTAACLLLGAGFLGDLIIRKVKMMKYKVLLCGALVVCLMLVWVELAVGIFGTPFSGS